MPALNGVFYRYHQGGMKIQEPVLFLHGAGGDSRVWPLSIRRMQGFRVYLVDLPGHGYSKGVCRHSVREYFNVLFDILNQLKVYRLFWVGQGVGGAIGVEFARRYPDRVAGLFLVNTVRQFFIPDRVLDALKNYQRSELFYDLIPFGMPRTRKQFVASQVEKLAADLRSSVLVSDLFVLKNWCFEPDQHLDPKIPIKLILGTADRLLGDYVNMPPFSENEEYQMVQVRGGGHWLSFERPDFLTSNVSAFLSQKGGRPFN
jgi:pimeloyl-ACP methyl ester carboxylesterase